MLNQKQIKKDTTRVDRCIRCHLIGAREVILVSADSVMTKLWEGLRLAEGSHTSRDSSKARLHQIIGKKTRTLDTHPLHKLE